MAVLCWMNTIQHSPRSGRHKLFTSCIWRCLVSHAWDWVISALSAALLNFQFPIQSVFLPYIGRKAAPAVQRIGFNTQYWTSDVVKNLGRYLSCTECTAQRKDFELILMVKMETRHPVGGWFGSEFPATCNRCVVMATWSHNTWIFCKQFCEFFLEKRPLMVKFTKFSSENLHGDTDRRCCVQMS